MARALNAEKGANMLKKKFAVVLTGCGHRDGSEIREAVGTLWALSKNHVEAQCFAPDADQADVVNGLTGEPAGGERRNQLVEAARIARGKIRPLSHLNAHEFNGLILPGGFGAAKNLCTFAAAGAAGTVLPDLQRVLEAMQAARKPIGAICIAPAIVGLAFKGRGFELTVGEGGEASQELEKLGHRHVVCRADECHVDRDHRVVTTPAYMYDHAPLHEIFAGIEKLVHEVVALAN